MLHISDGITLDITAVNDIAWQDGANNVAYFTTTYAFDLPVLTLSAIPKAGTTFDAASSILRAVNNASTKSAIIDTHSDNGVKLSYEIGGNTYEWTLTSTINGGDIRYTNLADATADKDALNRQTGDARYLRSGVALDLPIETITAATTLDDTHYTVLCDATAAAFTVTLPAASGATGRIYNIKKIDSGANAVTVDADGAETIDGDLTAIIGIQYTNIKIQCDGSNWYIL